MAQIKPLPAELQKVAIDELGEVPARIPKDLQALKEWIDRQPHLRPCTDDQFLIQFLRGCKYSLERAKGKIDHFYAMKTKYPHILGITNVDDEKFRQFHNTGTVVVLPKPLNENGPRIFVTRVNFSTQEYTLHDLLRYIEAIFEVIILDDPYACINGVVVIADFAKATANHFLQITPNLVKTAVKYHEKAFTLRFKKICYLNLQPYAEQVLKMVLSYLPEKLKQRIVICGKDLDMLDEHIPKKYLPQDYGGENGALDEVCADYNKVWDTYREYFKQNVNYGTDENLRLGKPLVFDAELLTTEGSFRRLDVD